MLDSSIIVIDAPESNRNATKKGRKLLEGSYLQEVLETGTMTTATNTTTANTKLDKHYFFIINILYTCCPQV